MQTVGNDAERKIETYLGFCLKAGKITLGVDRSETLKRANLLLWDPTLSENSREKALRLRERLHCEAIVCEGTELSALLHRPGCKLAAVTDKNLAEAILREAENNGKFRLLRGVGGNV